MRELTVHNVERIALLLVGTATLVSLLLWDRSVVLGVGLGGLVAAINFFALRRILQGMFRAAGTNPQKQALLGILLTLKFGILATTLFLIVKFVAVSPVALLVGISLVVISIFVEGIFAVFRGVATQSE